jgi:hypothetical protein
MGLYAKDAFGMVHYYWSANIGSKKAQICYANEKRKISKI